MMKYAIIAEYTTGERSGATVKADNLAEAWKKALIMFDPRYTRSIQIAEILLPAREG
jgi:hypothetical protein